MDKKSKVVGGVFGALLAGRLIVYLVQKAQAAPGIKLSGLTISPGKVNPYGSVTISVLARNNSDIALSGTIALGGDFMDQQKVTLNPGESQVVEFVVTPTALGRYQVKVDGLSGYFDCVAEPVADIRLSNLIIDPSSCYRNEEVVVSAIATNHGDAAGTRDILPVVTSP